MSPINTFEDLECYKTAREFRIVVVDWAKQLPSEEKYRLVDQTIRAVRSITANIAEGFGRQHPTGKLAILSTVPRISDGSFRTLEYSSR